MVSSCPATHEFVVIQSVAVNIVIRFSFTIVLCCIYKLHICKGNNHLVSKYYLSLNESVLLFSLVFLRYQYYAYVAFCSYDNNTHNS